MQLLRGCDDDATALSIAITRQQAGGKSSLAGRMVLCSVGIGQLAKVERVRAPFAHLPLVLVKASAALARTILHWLEETFDCAVTPMALTPQDMAWIATEWAAPAATDKALAQRPLTLQYGVPGDGSLQTISYSVDPASIRALQERLAGGDDDTALLRALEKHFAAEFSVDLTKMTLARVGTYAVYIGADGRAKFLPLPDTCATATLHALKYFTYVATRPPTT
ncbi:hypothetical protein PTSG_08114 [Salpingoeca rosetta]|uniref:Uncharacterized protein n=1 Tax=Salpingoeca rosetta (strain ATCC 50818 / BSB-021) TaxID=946362 RepID=F2UI13_SALR5|nr:uncharacterized protein PTSG_08114 [Salpingoeca rosetta]EGD76762.1 hypothetical protein PTSG_08114 [Salpingoeca rosetta]|eukprot:XP_004991134.1 hypothetical protein PTSG_08114 [Salpingoeca rosetta]